jgi:adenosylcobinamide-phosphate synthase
VQLGGRNSYQGRAEQRGLLGDGRPPDAGDITRAVRLSRLVSAAALGLAAIVAWRRT